MTAFLIAAALLVIAVIALLLPPLLRTPRFSGSTDQSEANLAIFRDQLAELAANSWAAPHTPRRNATTG